MKLKTLHGNHLKILQDIIHNALNYAESQTETEKLTSLLPALTNNNPLDLQNTL